MSKSKVSGGDVTTRTMYIYSREIKKIGDVECSFFAAAYFLGVEIEASRFSLANDPL